MGVIRNWLAGRLLPREPGQAPRNSPIIAATNKELVISTFDDKNITYTGNLQSYDYDSILRDKQGKIQSLYQLADYYVDADSIFRGIIKGVYTPFSIVNGYRLVGANEKTKQKYEEYYDRIHLRDKMMSIFYQYYKYGNVYVYLMEDGNIITLPVHKVKIANVMANGEPIVMLNTKSIGESLRASTSEQKDFIKDDDLKVRLDGFPPEVADAIRKGKEWVQLNPDNTFVLQDIKEDWMRYAVPMIASCLPALAKKSLISEYEKSILNQGISGFLHVTYGDKEGEAIADQLTLETLNRLFRQTMTGGAVVVTNQYVKANVIQPDTKFLFEFDHYKEVNAEILSAGGISGVIVSGQSGDGSTFASAQVSMQTANIRIRQAQENFCEMMNKINARLNGILPHSAKENLPEFTFPPVDLAGNTKFQESCLRLWKEGVLSHETMLQIHGFDMNQEVERRKAEKSKGIDETLAKPSANGRGDTGGRDGEAGTNGRPTLDNEERASDPGNSATGRQPKPSRPEGSEPQEEQI